MTNRILIILVPIYKPRVFPQFTVLMIIVLSATCDAAQHAKKIADADVWIHLQILNQ